MNTQTGALLAKPGSRSRVRRRRGRPLASGCERGRSLFQAVVLLLHLAQLLAQAHQLLALGAGQAFFARLRLALITRVLRDPGGNAVRRRAKPTRQPGCATGAGQFNDFLETRRVRQVERYGAPFLHVALEHLGQDVRRDTCSIWGLRLLVPKR